MSSVSKQKTEFFESEEQEKYLLYSKAAINHALLNLSKRPETLTAYFNQGREYLLTAILAVLPERGLIVLEYSPNDKLNQQLLSHGRAICVARPENIHIKFSCDGLQQARFAGCQAFAAPLPENLYRRQRREFFRISTSIAYPVYCHIPRAGEDELILSVEDIGCGGIGLIASTLAFNPEIGAVFPECTIDLLEFGSVTLDLEICNNFLRVQHNGRKVRCLGCAFHALSQDKISIIQHYIYRLQFEQRALAKR